MTKNGILQLIDEFQRIVNNDNSTPDHVKAIVAVTTQIIGGLILAQIRTAEALEHIANHLEQQKEKTNG